MAPMANVASQKIGLEAKFVSPSVTKILMTLDSARTRLIERLL